MIMEQEVEGNKVKMITYFDELKTMNGKWKHIRIDTLVSSMQIKNSIPEGEVKMFLSQWEIIINILYKKWYNGWYNEGFL